MTLTFIQTVSEAPTIVYPYLTVPALQWIWLCEDAGGDARVDGHYRLSWNNGDYVNGTYTAVEQDKHITMTWNARGMTAESQVQIDLKVGDGNCTVIEVKHSGVSAEHEAQVKQQWEGALENLKYTLETGLDYRFMSRPMLGIFPAALNDKQVEELKLPSKEGVYVTGVLAGRGAEAAGITAGDVIVGLNGKPVTDGQSLPAAILDRKAGDTVDVVLYRDGEKQTLSMTLSSRPLPEWPLNLKEIVNRMEKEEAEVSRELDELLATTHNDEMRQRPAPNEWSGNDVLAHLIWVERFEHFVYWGLARNMDFMEYPSNDDIQMAGILAAYPTCDMLLEELKRAMAASRAMIAALPESAPKAFVARIAAGQPGQYIHTRQHMQQIREALQAIRQASGVVS